MKRLYLALGVLALGVMACGTSAPRRQLQLYPSPTILPTQTPYVVILTATIAPTITPQTKSELAKASETVTPSCFTVSAEIAVYLRPSPSTDNYPIAPLPNGAQLADLGGRNGNWYYVAYGEYQGWVDGAFVEACQ